MLKKRDRLTIRYKCGVPDAAWWDKTYPCAHCPYDMNVNRDCTSPVACDFAIMLNHLAAYEETGLTPDDIIKLKNNVKRLKEKNAALRAQLSATTENT